MEQFYQAAFPLIRQKGVDAVSIAEIAEAAGYSKGSLYNYFASKDEFVCALLRWGLLRFTTAIKEVVSNESHSYCLRLSELRSCLRSTLSDGHELMMNKALKIASRKVLPLSKCDEELRPLAMKVQQLVADFFQKGMDDGHFHPINPTRLANFFIHSVIGQGFLDRLHAVQPDESDSEQFYNQLFNLMILKNTGETQGRVTI